ncbi:MAG: Holliday junction DNA helicase RuvA [Candidatus Magasanikbacteria bacterium RIFCSPHIGHO2_01_FULL_41_23]|uniref:Holliday junction branch migration complex subunit RuvA n=1 Tax=Candidatus Magasanikbacteria bacterium RIFCSPLOWO2_01_FULL_40_15 TaxID=1798686 RepID=A0A1F6N3H0_9BACT|nr:MAG: Holliday junction DNA helicase RuvA [Candidatus Magasanikbacteria bacterium RIFCSPHIGHO2_01_FULL_41_23]OGH75044.1 MAG: Holliday junction DNA helicase RuvA [Candidatus Magasanikbacteria bacterium RIFCSPHIGHO2_12_FULL_41_16]OGH78298.1 MAG: Holliday junction DNA helicase RuvA [Candidatus Magasanikbacteria bacterium RIFCSPLOWO2_01_FULL_40_15]
MIASISGKIIGTTKNGLIVETESGLGYEVQVTPTDKMSGSTSLTTSSTVVRFFTYLKISEQAHDLYGFSTMEAREFFNLLLTVSGIGPKTALNILSLGSIDVIQAAIARGDVTYLTAVQGMGKKTAERVVVELKSKLKSQSLAIDSSVSSGVLGDVVDGLITMGYSSQEAREVVQSLQSEGKTSEVLLREALQMLAR